MSLAACGSSSSSTSGAASSTTGGSTAPAATTGAAPATSGSAAATSGTAASSTASAAPASTGTASTAPATSGAASATPSTAPVKSNAKVGLVFDIGGKGDKSFNDAADTGLLKAVKDMGITEKELTPNSTGSDRETLLTLLASGGYNPIIGVGYSFEDAMKKVAGEYPKTNFAIIDDVVDLPNVASLTFQANESSYVVGAIAALKDTTNQVGFIGGVDVPLLQSFQAGFDAGAKHVKPGIKIDDVYLSEPPDQSGFSAPDKAKEAAKGMYDNGADVVYTAAGGSGAGAFAAAKAAGKFAIGVDSDQYLTADPSVKSVIITSALKRVDTAVYLFIKDFAAGKKDHGVQVYDLKNGGVGYATSGGQVDQYKTQIAAIEADIASGKITVPDKE